MAQFLSRFSLRVQIGSLVLLAGIILASCGVVLWGGREVAEVAGLQAARERSLLDHVTAVQIALLDARRYEKDFLLRHSLEAVTKHGDFLGDTKTGLAGLAADIDSGDGARRRTVQELGDGVQRYADLFARLVGLQKRIGLTENDGLQGTLRASVHQVEDALNGTDEPRLSILMLMMRRHEKDFFARQDAKYIDELTQRAEDFRRALATSKLSAPVQAHLLDLVRHYRDDFVSAAAAIQDRDRMAEELTVGFLAFEPQVRAFYTDSRGRMVAATAEAGRVAAVAARLMTWVMAGGFLGMGIIGMAIARSIYRPLDTMTLAMTRLAEGDLAVEIPARERRDEVGAMARALQIFKTAMRETERLRLTQEQDRQQAERDKVAALQRMAETVEMETRAAVGQVAALTTRMAEKGDGMAQSAATVGANSQSVAAAAAQALTNAQSVAAAAEELNASIGEIARQVGASSQVTAGAVVIVRHAERTIGKLSAAVGHIGDVAELIHDIAARTNLLALNATIEAARAGVAGKGFAVVAGEVKGLANQTARATGEITAQIAEIQAVTADAVHSVGEIGRAIADVQQVAAVVASAIEEQGATTQAIARSVVETTDAAQEVAARISQVSTEAQSTGESARQVGLISAEVATGVDHLREVLVRVVRTSTREVNRRHLPRYRLGRPGTLLVAGRSHAITIENISQGGLMASGLPAGVSDGMAVEIVTPGASEPLPATVLTAEHGRLHGKFELVPAESHRWETELARLVAGLEPLEETA